MKKNKVCPSCKITLIWSSNKQCGECYRRELDERAKHCRVCGVGLTSDNVYKTKQWRNNTCKQCQKDYHSNRYRNGFGERQKQERQELKARVINHYGGACACCRESNLIFLAIDHIDGGGNKHKRKIGGLGHTLYSWLEDHNYPSGFQVLCHNCNYAKHHYGVCPHKR